MAPIRVALIGLSSSAKTSWAAEAHLPYLLSSRGKSHYEIVALLNSSVASAKAAIAEFSLPSTVKAYGDPSALAADPDIDLVVCNTRVDVHFPTTFPAIKAGKAAFIEWPLAENLEKGLELTGGKRLDNSIIGVQGRVTPILNKIREVMASGRIGRVLSSDVRAFGNLNRRNGFSEGLSYFAQRKIGGNPITIAFTHMIDYVHTALGEFDTFQARAQIQRPNISVFKKDGTQQPISTDVPDFVSIHGPLKAKDSQVVEGATLAITFRGGPAFKGKPAFQWSINGEKGEMLVTSPSGPFLHSDSYNKPIQIQIHDHETDEVDEVAWDWEEWQEELPIRARNIGGLYERYASWIESGKPDVDELPQDKQWPRLHDAVDRLRELDTLFAQFDAQKV
jgi:predicted dehydrogenase